MSFSYYAIPEDQTLKVTWDLNTCQECGKSPYYRDPRFPKRMYCDDCRSKVVKINDRRQNPSNILIFKRGIMRIAFKPHKLMDVARAVGVNRSTFINWGTKGRMPNDPVLISKLCRHLRISKKRLFELLMVETPQ